MDENCREGTSTQNAMLFAVLETSGRKIQKVPQVMRNGDAYDPKVVSFGPYHHGKPKLQLCEQGKCIVLEMFVKGSTNKTQEFFYTKVLEAVGDARNCYIKGSTDKYTVEEFAKMMLLDACFLIYFIYMGTGAFHQAEELVIYNHLGGSVLSLVNRDIFLLENQIPFQILMLLINSRYDQGDEALRRFLHRSIWGEYEQQKISHIQKRQRCYQPLHLLEAFHRVLVWDWTPEHHVQVEDCNDVKRNHRTFRSVKDLKAKGIHFRPSTNKSLKDINFNSFTLYGQLQLPTWFVSCLSKVFFANMIAYELCPNNVVDTPVTTYISFMKSLVESRLDVKELREKRILLTSLSDKEVVRLYRDLETYGMAETTSFQEVRRRIQAHYDSKTKTWMAELIHTYLSSPWSVIAWLAGLLLLILTLLQTYFTINQEN